MVKANGWRHPVPLTIYCIWWKVLQFTKTITVQKRQYMLFEDKLYCIEIGLLLVTCKVLYYLACYN